MGKLMSNPLSRARPLTEAPTTLYPGMSAAAAEYVDYRAMWQFPRGGR